jgi:hypothetical protein
MRHLIIGCLALLALACGSAPSQTGPISQCSGISLSGAGAFTPLSGMVFQTTANLGGGQSAPGTYEVVIWGGTLDGGATPTQSLQAICQQLLNNDFTAAVFVAPQTVEFNLPDSLSANSYSTTIFDLTQPLAESAMPLEDLLGTVNINGAGSQCLSGSFTADVVPVDPTSGFAIDGGAATQISGVFGLPYCG